MGWQSYFILFTTDEEKEMILQTIRDHNTTKNHDIVGEELVSICESQLKRKRKRKSLNRVILFGNGGGRGLTFKYFEDHGFNF